MKKLLNKITRGNKV